MAKLKMKKIEIAGLMSDSKDIIDLLQRSGFIELTEQEELPLFSCIDTNYGVSQTNKYLSYVSQARDTLKQYVPMKGKGLAGMLTPRSPITLEEYLKRSGDTDKILNLCFDINSSGKRITDSRAAIIRNNTLIESISPWKALDIPMSWGGSAHTAMLVGTLPERYDRESILLILASELPELDAYDIEIVSASQEQTNIAILCMKADAPELERVLRGHGFSRPSELSKQLPAERIDGLNEENKRLEKLIQESIDAVKSYSESYDDIDFLEDYLILRRDKYTQLSRVLMSDNVFFLTGYIPQERTEKLLGKITKKYDIAYMLHDIAEDEEEPVLLKNNGFVAPVESVTAMYALPLKEDIDPTPVMSFFYYFFFGMMFSDGGYGLIMVLGTAFALIKFDLEEKMRNTCKMFLYCGISTVFWGAMYGSWFGDIINVIRTDFMGLETVRLHVWMDPLNEIMKLLVYCFIFGIVHLFVGVGVKAVMLLRKGKVLDAFCESIPAYLSVLGIAPTFLGLFSEQIPQVLKTYGMYMFIAGLVLVVLTAGRESKSIGGKLGSGLFAVYNLISGYLGDVLSYSRLLALGLATGVIASVINMLVALPQSMALKIIMLIVVFPLGQIANFAINVIGAYVHACRLQFVEFFGKFYDGGGKAFDPLRVNTKHYRFKAE